MLLHMTITQTVKVPANRWLKLEVPREITTESVDIAFTPAKAPAKAAPAKPRMTEEEEMALFELHAEDLNREAADAFLYQRDMWDPSLPPSAEVLDESLIQRRES